MQVETEVVVPVVQPVTSDFTVERLLYKNRSHMKPRLDKALEVHGAPDQIRLTLLRKETQERHAEWLSERFIQKFIKNYNAHNAEIARVNASRCQLGLPETLEVSQKAFAWSHVRMITVLYEVVDLGSDRAIQSVAAMNKQIQATVRKIKHMSCLGVPEVEVISIPLLEKLDEVRSGTKNVQLPDGTTEPYEKAGLIKTHRAKTSRKKIVCKDLYTGFQTPVFSGDYSQLLVHFHGVLIAKNEADFDKLRNKLKSLPAFAKTSYQIEIKKLTEGSWGGKTKTPTENLHCIANYLTKGAASRTKNNEADYKFKVKFDHDGPVSEQQAQELEFLDQQVIDAANVTSTSHQYRTNLSTDEVFVLADTVNKLMNMKSDRTGYLVQVGGWSGKGK